MTRMWDVPVAHPMMSRTLIAPHTRGARATYSLACYQMILTRPAQRSMLRRPCCAPGRSPRETPPHTQSRDASGVCLCMQAAVTEQADP